MLQHWGLFNSGILQVQSKHLHHSILKRTLRTIQKQVFMGRLIQALVVAGAPMVSEKMGIVGLLSGPDIEGTWFHFNHLPVVEWGCG
jgi:hypothetical protein